MPNRDPTSAARVLLFLLLLTPVSPNCRKGTVEECKKADLVPRGVYAGSSVDILSLRRRRIHQEFTKPEECTVCENPLLKGRPLQSLNSVITDWKANISCLQKVQHSVHQSLISVAEVLMALKVKNDWREGLDVKIDSSDKVQWALGGSHSKFIKEWVEDSNISPDNYTFLFDYMRCSFYTLSINKIMLLNDNFNYSIENLPEKYNHSSESDYFDVISRFGTHWMKEIDYGAQLVSLTSFPVCEAVLGGLRLSKLSHCVPVEMGIPFGINSTEFKDCMEMLDQYNIQHTVRIRETEGGMFYSGREGWLEHAKSWPGIISYSLEPLHTLLGESEPRRESLRQAVSEYVRKFALRRKCSQPCPAGSQLSSSGFCSCECPSNDFTDSMCCAPKRGTAKLTVTIRNATDLRGDLISRSDGYVSVSFKNRKMCTHTVWNDNNPNWNTTLDFGAIELDKDFNKMQVEVWDQDSGWNDDLLGWCNHTLEYGRYWYQYCYLKHGVMRFSYSLECGPNLIGSSCWAYSANRPYPKPHLDFYHY